SGRPIYVIPSSISLTGASMLISGTEKLERMRDGRAIYIGAERVSDVTHHPAFRNAARTIADLYDLKADPQQHDLFSFEENGERYGLWWLRCRTREDLHARDESHCGRNLWPHRALARPRRGPGHRPGNEARATRRTQSRVWGESYPLLRTCT